MNPLGSPWVGVAAIAVGGAVGMAFVDDPRGPLTLDEVAITVQARRTTGAPWDFGGGQPDPQLQVTQAGRVLARCPEARDQLELRCPVHARVDRAAGPVQITVVDKDSSDDDAIGELAIDLPAAGRTIVPGAGGLATVELVTRGGGGVARLLPLWIGLAVGCALALARYLVWRPR